jgi:hypothetical protein
LRYFYNFQIITQSKQSPKRRKFAQFGHRSLESGRAKVTVSNFAPFLGNRHSRVGGARWFTSKPKILIWVNFGGPWNRKCWYSLCPYGIFYGQLVYVTYGRLVWFVVIWYSFSQFGMFGPRKIWQP